MYNNYIAWYKNFKRKITKGNYTRALAIKGIRDNYVPLIARKYRKEFGLPNVDRATKEHMARQIVDALEADIKNNEYG